MRHILNASAAAAVSVFLFGCTMMPNKAPLVLRDDQVQVGAGDTIYTLAEKYKVSPKAIMEENKLSSASIVPGEILRMPKKTELPRAAYVPLEGEVPPPAAPIPSDAQPVSSLTVTEAVDEAPEAPRVESRVIEYMWPVKGNVVEPFGKGQGAQASGILVTADPGTSINASKAGEVIYAGGDLPDYGNLVLVRHDDGTVTAYGRLQNIAVKKGDKLDQGQRVAEVAIDEKTGAGRFYFELRKPKGENDAKTKPVNPLPYLAD